MRHLADCLTLGRMVGSFVLLLLEPFTMPFFLVYTLCGLSDMFDGPVARHTGGATRLGAILDSIADFIFITIAMIIFLPLLLWRPWMLWWIAGIVLVRFVSLSVGFAKYHALAFLHTYANKIAGGALFLVPYLYPSAGLFVPIVVVCSLASLSAVEELAINILSPNLNRNAPGLFRIRSAVVWTKGSERQNVDDPS